MIPQRYSPSLPQQKNVRNRLVKRGIRKSYTQLLVAQLAARHGLGSGSPSKMAKEYSRAFYCGTRLVVQGDKLITEYCKSRVCTVCNSIRTANLINGYGSQLAPFIEAGTMQLVTLTAKTPHIDDLTAHLNFMGKAWSKILGVAHKQKRGLVGIRVLECHGCPEDHAHPHFHVLIDGVKNAYWLKWEWIKRLGAKASSNAQDVRTANKKSLTELFKYVTKTSMTMPEDKKKTKYKFNHSDEELDQLDVIYCALRGRRTIQPFGGIKKVSEDLEERRIDALTAEYEDDRSYLWVREVANYVGEDTGVLLIDYRPSRRVLRGLQRLKAPPVYVERGTYRLVYPLGLEAA